MDQSMARYYLTRDVYKLIRISDESFGRFGLSLAFSKAVADLKENITSILLSYVDKGNRIFIERFFRMNFRYYSTSS